MYLCVLSFNRYSADTYVKHYYNLVSFIKDAARMNNNNLVYMKVVLLQRFHAYRRNTKYTKILILSLSSLSKKEDKTYPT